MQKTARENGLATHEIVLNLGFPGSTTFAFATWMMELMIKGPMDSCVLLCFTML